MRKNLKPEDLGDFLELGNCAILATHFRDGRVLLSPVWFEWRDNGFTVILEVGDTKARQIEQDPAVSIIVTEDTMPYRSLEVRGKARVIPGDAAAVVHRYGAPLPRPGARSTLRHCSEPATSLVRAD